MGLKISKGHTLYEFVRWKDIPADGPSLTFHSPSSARRFLNDFLNDGFGMQTLRRLVTMIDPNGVSVNQYNSHEVVDLIAGNLVNGSLIVVGPLKDEITDRPILFLLSVPALRPMANPVRMAPMLSKSIESTVDQGLIAQSQALRVAAEVGTPFCDH